MRFFTSSGFSRTSKPATVAVPALGGRKQVSMRMVVVLPAPFGPRNPTIWPFSTENEMRSTAVVRAYRLVSSETLIIVICWQRQDCRAETTREHGVIVYLKNNSLRMSKTRHRDHASGFRNNRRGSIFEVRTSAGRTRSDDLQPDS